MRVEILTIGNELLSGVILDTNGAWLAERLYERGVLVERKTTLLDDVASIAAVLTETAARCELVVVCGGLGPTGDDLTAEAAARAAGVPVVRSPEAARLVTDYVAGRGLQVSERQLGQADLPEGCEVIPNPLGTAPAFAMQYGDCRAVFFPGPPREFRPLVDSVVLPWVDARSGAAPHAALTLRTFGKTESRLADLVGAVEGLEDVEVGYRVLFPEIHLRLRATADSPEAARERVEAAGRTLQSALGPLVFGLDEESFPFVVGEALAGAGLTLALAESCTGGVVSAALTEVPGASRHLLLSAVVYSNAAKTEVLGVPAEVLETDGAVSERCAAAMAEGARRVAQSDLAVAITGIAGPGGGTEEKPVGTICFALADASETRTETRVFRGDRDQVRKVGAWYALSLIRRWTLERSG